jgi:hypothetical protein
LIFTESTQKLYRKFTAYSCTENLSVCMGTFICLQQVIFGPCRNTSSLHLEWLKPEEQNLLGTVSIASLGRLEKILIILSCVYARKLQYVQMHGCRCHACSEFKMSFAEGRQVYTHVYHFGNICHLISSSTEY